MPIFDQREMAARKGQSRGDCKAEQSGLRRCRHGLGDRAKPGLPEKRTHAIQPQPSLWKLLCQCCQTAAEKMSSSKNDCQTCKLTNDQREKQPAAERQ